jgi:hypothetical protein
MNAHPIQVDFQLSLHTVNDHRQDLPLPSLDAIGS